MSEKRRKLIIIMLLPAALIWAAFNMRSDQTPPEMETIAPLPGAQLAGVNATPAQNSFRPKARINELDQLPWGSDPFKAPATGQIARVISSTGWIVRGIVYNPDKPMAYVNSQMVTVGDTVDDAEVLEITKTTVTLKHRGQRIDLTVNKG